MKIFKNLLSFTAPDSEFRIRRIVKSLIDKNPGKEIRILDLGGGAGHIWRSNSFYFEQISKGSVEITLIDAHITDNSYNGLTYSKGVLPGCLIEFDDNSFDLVIACDVLEHLPKHDGFFLLYEIERITSTMGFIFSPNGFLKQSPNVRNAHNAHISSWTPREMLDFKWQKHRGHSGFRFLFATYGHSRFALKNLFYNRFLLVLLGLTRLFVHRIPGSAFSFSSIFIKKANNQDLNFSRIVLDL